jgi:hypothetical protein
LALTSQNLGTKNYLTEIMVVRKQVSGKTSMFLITASQSTVYELRQIASYDVS